MYTRDKPAINLNLPKIKIGFKCKTLFAFFYNLSPEWINKEKICYALEIEADDYFGLLMHDVQFDTIGAVHIRRMNMS